MANPSQKEAGKEVLLASLHHFGNENCHGCRFNFLPFCLTSMLSSMATVGGGFMVVLYGDKDRLELL